MVESVLRGTFWILVEHISMCQFHRASNDACVALSQFVRHPWRTQFLHQHSALTCIALDQKDKNRCFKFSVAHNGRCFFMVSNIHSVQNKASNVKHRQYIRLQYIHVFESLLRGNLNYWRDRLQKWLEYTKK